MTAIHPGSGASVKTHTLDPGMLRKEGGKSVWHNGGCLDIGIQATLTRTKLQNVPESDPMREEALNALLVRETIVQAENITDDASKGVTGVRVIFTDDQR
jgi:hypothetical protein